MKNLIGTKLLFILAHPDDESFLVSGTIRANVDAGGQSVVICATLGERGTSHLAQQVTPAELRDIRKRELIAASEYMGTTKLHEFTFPDGGLREVPDELYTAFLPIAKAYAPDHIISFGPDGISGHLDHVTVGDVSLRIAETLGVPFLAIARPPALRTVAKHWFREKRKEGLYLEDFDYLQSDVTVPIDGKVKYESIRFHASQLDGGEPFGKIPKEAADEMMKAEHFVDYSRIAAPSRAEESERAAS